MTREAATRDLLAAIFHGDTRRVSNLYEMYDRDVPEDDAT